MALGDGRQCTSTESVKCVFATERHRVSDIIVEKAAAEKYNRKQTSSSER